MYNTLGYIFKVLGKRANEEHQELRKTRGERKIEQKKIKTL